MSDEQAVTSVEGEDVKATTENEESTATGMGQEQSNELATKLMEELTSLTKRLDDQSRIIGKLTNAKKKEEPAPVQEQQSASEDVEAKPTDLAKFTELQAEVAKLKADNEAKRNAVKLGVIEKHLVENGTDQKNAKPFAEFLSYKMGDQIQAVDDGSGGVSVIVDVDGESAGFGEWSKMYMESDAGAFMRGTRRGPSTKNIGQATSTSQQAVTQPEYAKMVAKYTGEGKSVEEVKSLMSNVSIS